MRRLLVSYRQSGNANGTVITLALRLRNFTLYLGCKNCIVLTFDTFVPMDLEIYFDRHFAILPWKDSFRGIRNFNSKICNNNNNKYDNFKLSRGTKCKQRGLIYSFVLIFILL